MRGRESLSVLVGSRQPGDGQHPQFPSQLWIDFKGNALSRPSLCNRVLFKAAYLEIPFVILFCFRDLPRTLRSFLSRSHGTDVSTHLCSIPHLGVDPSHGSPPPTRQSTNANVRIRTSGVSLAKRLQNPAFPARQVGNKISSH